MIMILKKSRFNDFNHFQTVVSSFESSFYIIIANNKKRLKVSSIQQNIQINDVIETIAYGASWVKDISRYEFFRVYMRVDYIKRNSLTQKTQLKSISRVFMQAIVATVSKPFVILFDYETVSYFCGTNVKRALRLNFQGVSKYYALHS